MPQNFPTATTSCQAGRRRGKPEVSSRGGEKFTSMLGNVGQEVWPLEVAALFGFLVRRFDANVTDAAACVGSQRSGCCRSQKM